MPTFIDHVSIPVADFSTSAAFYDAVLATLGMQRRKENDIGIGWGPPETAAPIFWIIAQKPGSASAGLGLHISFRAKDRAEVHAFHETALRHGAADAGAPGIRPQYTAGFYGCFILDPDGFKIEAVVREALPPRD
ncbi:MAG TPA: VOC family protein [Hyphomonadaceae bacterium]|jgi:catechol 2,3-dioxygenase-like lactoylglutathione lyase family enzyme|nr:VOC family protein [Hyphomonadaceae bacterium]HPI50553.1 VOC family protein [Hyphomonadaceae bacterium]